MLVRNIIGKKAMKQNYNVLIIVIVLLVIFSFRSISRKEIVGDLTFPYTFAPENRGAMYFGSNYFLPSTLSFNCADQYDKNAWVWKTPSNCWSTSITWKQGDKIEKFIMFKGETKKLNDYLEVTFNPTGHTNYEFGGHDLRHWSNNFVFKIINKDFLKIKVIDDSYEIVLNSDKKMKIEIENKFANNLNGGVWTKSTNLLLFREKTLNSYFKLNKGINEYETVPVSTDFLGTIRVEAKPFIVINNKVNDIKLMDSEPIYVEYKVVRELSEDSECFDYSEVCCSDGIVRRNCDRVRLGLTKGNDCENDVEAEEGDFPEEGTIEVKEDKTLLYIAGIVLVFLILSTILKNGKK